ncbi:hypothetical protein SAMN06295888_10282 [Desulfonatronum zhilinae]|nr:hypothetical protein SAMN06295888_10282 [Desulfonatronum zhilinae]
MQHTIFIDLETLPGESRPDPSEIQAPANYKDPAKIAAYQLEKVEEAYRRQALDSMTGRILTIGYAIDDADPVALTVGMTVETETEALERLEDVIDPLPRPIVWAGHNVRAFDLQWLWRRSIRHDCARLAQTIPRERYSKYVIDSMEIWAGPDYQARVSLDKVARFLGLGAKTEGMDGSKVFDFWQDGKLEEISEYCLQDVALARDVIRVLTFGQGRLTCN